MSAAGTRFSILLPVIRPPAVLPFAIESVLAQTVTDFELFVVCDGAPKETIACARKFGKRDPRVKTFALPKGERHGEAHRHAALADAAGQYVAHISDDDLWFPNHLEELEQLLKVVDFGNVQSLDIYFDGKIDAKRGDLTVPAFRHRLATTARTNRFGPTFVGYRLDAYRRLPEGWHPAPPGISTDHYMWQKFLRRDDITFGSRAAVTALHFSSPQRAHMSLDDRVNEVRAWFERIQTPEGRAEITELTWRSLAHQSVEDENLILSLAGAQAVTPSGLAELASAAEERDAALRSLADTLAEAKAENERHRAQYAEAREEIAALSAAHGAAEAEIKRLADARADAESKAGRLMAARTEAESEIGSLMAARLESNAEIARLTAAGAEAQAAIDRLTAAGAQARAEIARLCDASGRDGAAIARLNALGEEARAEIARLEAAAVDAGAEIARRTAACAEANSEVTRLTAALGSAGSEIARLNALGDEARAEIARLTATIAERDAEAVRLKMSGSRSALDAANYSAAHGRVHNQMEKILRSKSWRWTHPLRVSVRALRRLIGKPPDE